MDHKTVRELGGEFWMELQRAQAQSRDEECPLKLSVELEDRLVELPLGVLARHVGCMIVDDEDFPVTPLP